MAKGRKKAPKSGKRFASTTAAFSAAHNQFAASLAANAAPLTRTRTVQEIYMGLIRIIGRAINSPSDPVSQYLPPGLPPTIAAALNATDTLFHHDGLIFYPADFGLVDTMGKLGGKIIDKYCENHWTVPGACNA